MKKISLLAIGIIASLMLVSVAMGAEDEESTTATVTVNEHLSITVVPIVGGISFGSNDPGDLFLTAHRVFSCNQKRTWFCLS